VNKLELLTFDHKVVGVLLDGQELKNVGRLVLSVGPDKTTLLLEMVGVEIKTGEMAATVKLLMPVPTDDAKVTG
jgi:hypothetical protein